MTTAGSASRTRARTRFDVVSKDWDRPGGGVGLVGRDEEVARFDGLLDDLEQGRGGVVLIGGEAGIGKTRIAQEFATHADGRGFRVLWGECRERGHAPAFLPWVGVLRQLLAEISAAPTEARFLARLVPEALPGVDAIDAVDEESRYGLFEAVATQVVIGTPTVIVIEDIHWSDESSLQLLEHVAETTRVAPIVIVATYRDDHVRTGSPLLPVLASLARVSTATTIPVGALEPASAIVLALEVGGASVDDAAALDIAQRSDGRPFFISQLAAFRPVAREQWSIPDGVRALITLRLDELSPAALETLRAAAVLGRHFAAATLAEMVDRPTDAIAFDLDTATIARLVDSVPSLRFVHELVRETLYTDIAPNARRGLHRRAALVLEQDGEEFERSSEIAQHWLLGREAGDGPRVRARVRTRVEGGDPTARGRRSRDVDRTGARIRRRDRLCRAPRAPPPARSDTDRDRAVRGWAGVASSRRGSRGVARSG